MKPKWIFERGVHDHGTPERMMNFAREMGLEAIEVVFSEQSEYFNGILDVKRQQKLPFEKNDCVVMYGSFGMARYLLRKHAWVPGVWFDLDALSCREYYSRWGEFLLQQQYAMMPLSEVRRQKTWLFDHFHAVDVEGVYGRPQIFLRPDSQLKPFAGQVVTIDDFEKFWSEAMVYGTEETLTVVARPRNVRHEWRLVIKDRKVVTGSGYICGGEVEIHEGYPEAVAEYAEKVANATEWQPHPIYCMDICETLDGVFGGRYWLLEIGSVNTCGLYDCDLKKVVEAASEVAEREWNDVNT